MPSLHGIKVESKITSKKRRAGERGAYNANSFKGYAGLTHTAKEICDFIPKCKKFVEPFAGLGRITKNVKSEEYVLNDLSDFAIEYLRRHFKNHMITQVHYSECIRVHDGDDVLFFLDPPWLDNVYDVNPLSVLTEPAKVTYAKLQLILPEIKGDWIIAGQADSYLSKWDYHHHEVRSKKNYLFGKKARTYLVSNKPFKRYHQETLF